MPQQSSKDFRIRDESRFEKRRAKKQQRIISQSFLCKDCRRIPRILDFLTLDSLPEAGEPRQRQTRDETSDMLVSIPSPVLRLEQWDGHSAGVSLNVALDAQCPSCRQLASMISSLQFYEGATNLHFSPTSIGDSHPHLVAPLRKGVNIYMSNERGEDSNLGRSDFGGLNIHFAEKCLQQCLNSHKGNCHKLQYPADTMETVSIYLIDVKHKSLVCRTTQSKYTALSYEWGTSNRVLGCSKCNISKMREAGFFIQTNPSIPRTVVDAMRFTAYMGMRYLWVDRFCVVQDDATHKHSQIQAMGSIYYHAGFVIIAAEGGINQGLSVRDPSRPIGPSWCEELSSSRGIMYEPATDNTTWSTRGWTFQEQMLARRSFIFRGGTLIFQCQEIVWHEGIAFPVPRDEKAFSTASTKLTMYQWPNILYLKGLLEWFCARDLAYPCDSLDAFAGVLATLRASFQAGFLFGLPEVCFDIALLWQSKGSLEDRIHLASTVGQPVADLPSWSWARWKGPLDFIAWEAATECLLLSYYHQNICTITRIVHWRKESTVSGSLVPLNNSFGDGRSHAQNRSGQPATGWKKQPIGDVGESSTLSQLLCSTNHVFTYESLGRYPLFRFPIPLRTNDSCDLDDQVWTSKIRGRVNRAYLSIIRGKAGPEDDDCWLDVQAEPAAGLQSKVGVVQLHDTASENWNDGETVGEFIAISAGDFISVPGPNVGIPRDFLNRWEMEKQKDGGHIYRFYNVMLIGRQDDGSAVRRGLGRVEKALWESLSLEEVDVVLA